MFVFLISSRKIFLASSHKVTLCERDTGLSAPQPRQASRLFFTTITGNEMENSL